MARNARPRGAASFALGLIVLGALLLASCRSSADPTDPDLAVITPGDTLFSAVVSGWSGSCALTVGGRAFCWGDNLYGVLGSQSAGCPGEVAFTYCENRPIPAGGGLRFTRLAMSGTIACGITPSQRLYCWGDTPGGFDAPRGGALRFTDASVDSYVICALSTNGQTYCWGDNEYRQLGIPDGMPLQTLDDPRPVVGEHRFSTIQVTRGYVCGTTTSGSLFCWGSFADTARFDATGVALGQCAFSPHSTYPCTHVPLRWRGSEQWARYASAGPTCGITMTGGARCWGSALYWGSAVFGRSEPSYVLAAAPEAYSLVLPTPIRDIVYATDGACAHAVDGRLVCWGTTNRGVFATGSQNATFTMPTVAAGGRSFTQVSAGNGFMCGLAAGAIWCWGDGRRGVLGTGEVIPQDANGLRVVPTPTRIASIAGK